MILSLSVGTAGVWRREAMEDAGGWNNRTTVEDMDLSLRAYLKGWRFIFLNDVVVSNLVLIGHFTGTCSKHS